MAPQSSKVPATTRIIAVKFEGEKIREKKVRQMEGNYIINITLLTNVLREVAICRKCKEGGLEIFEDASGRFTFGSCLFIICEKCQKTQTFWTISGKFGLPKDTLSAPLGNWNQMDVAVLLGSRMIGIGHENIKMYHAILDIPGPPYPGKSDKIQIDVLHAAEMIAITSMDNAKKAIKQEQEANSSQDSIEIVASFDGSYPKKGKSSHLCFAFDDMR